MQRYGFFRTFAKIFYLKMSNFVQRTLSGAVYVGFVVAGILVHPIFFSVLFALVTILAVREFHHLMHSDMFLTVTSCIAALLMFGCAACVMIASAMGSKATPLVGIALVCFLLYVVLAFAVLISELFRKAENPIYNWGYFLGSQVMIAFPFSLMCCIMIIDKYLMLALFVLIWLNDSGAYCVGSLMAKRQGGNHKMFPRVSPGKSWEGLIGGALVAIAAGCLLAYLGWFDRIASGHCYLFGIVFSLMVVIFGTLGDLMESLMKRTIGVKDSGKFLPGHGGVLDRFDSILLATPAVLFMMCMYLFCI